MAVAVDLFAGGGGLTVGLKRAGFSVAAAVEIEPTAFSTYKANHPEVRGLRQDIRSIAGSSILNLSDSGQIDLLAGCPPCQGFTSLTSKYRRYDERNDLVLEMARLVRETLPSIVMMENVPGLVHKGKPLLEAFLRDLDEAGYIYDSKVLQVADYGVPQHRRRFVLLAGQGFPVPIPGPTHHRDGRNGLPKWKTLHEALSPWGLPPPVTTPIAKANGGPDRFNWHVVRELSSVNIARLRHIQPGLSRAQIPDDLRPECHRGEDKGFGNVYGRMAWDQVPVTITAGCTTLSKGRFGHPSEDRTISVREAALIQTFPLSYIFDSPYMEKVCDIVGNALPCDFAEVMANACMSALREHRREEFVP